jgi:hypothetical protein
MYIPIMLLVQLLKAINWIIAPYQNYDSWEEYPYVRELAKMFNKMLQSLDSQGYSHTFSYFLIK